MAKINHIFSFSGTFAGVTNVKSRAYGDHMRKARTKFTLSDGMKKSSEVMKEANRYAKAFKDAIDPYRKDFRDGQLWQRLVSLFKNQIAEEGTADFDVLEDRDLNKVHPLSAAFGGTATVTQSAGVLQVMASSHCTKDYSRGRADGHQQTIIVLFAHEDLTIESFVQSIVGASEEQYCRQDASFAIPAGATSAIIVLRLELCKDKKALGLQKGMGMRVEKVVRIIQDDTAPAQ